MILTAFLAFMLLAGCSPAEIKLAEEAINDDVKIAEQAMELELEVPANPANPAK